MTTETEIYDELIEAERKALDALSRYKFWMFGYWAAIWVHLNRLHKPARPSPFAVLVKLARQLRCEDCKKPLHFVRDRNFPDGSGRVWTCTNHDGKCKAAGLYVYPEKSKS